MDTPKPVVPGLDSIHTKFKNPSQGKWRKSGSSASAQHAWTPRLSFLSLKVEGMLLEEIKERAGSRR